MKWFRRLWARICFHIVEQANVERVRREEYFKSFLPKSTTFSGCRRAGKTTAINEELKKLYQIPVEPDPYEESWRRLAELDASRPGAPRLVTEDEPIKKRRSGSLETKRQRKRRLAE